MSYLLRVVRAITDFSTRSKPRIFISYRRRGEGAGYAGRLADRLIHEFGADQCFRDIDDIETGTDFVDEISRAVGGCEVLIVVIGPDWVDVRDRDGMRRLDDPRDFVRLEVAAALARGIRVVPVLVGGASMPALEKLPSAIEGLARRQAHELTDNRWEYDVGRLVSSIESMGVRRRTKQRRPVRVQWKRAAVLTGALATTAAAAVPVARGLGILANGDHYDYDTPIDAKNPTIGAVNDPATMQKDLNNTLQGILTTMAANNAQTGTGGQSDYKGDNATVRTASTNMDVASADVRRDGIIAALRRANNAETRAMRSLDPSVLVEAFTGDALQLENLGVAALQLAGERSVNELHDQQIISIDVHPAGDLAVVEAIEVWSSMRVDAESDECLYRLARHRVPQTVHLMRIDDRWIVSSITTRGEQPEEQPCSR
jgi:hypothetical protein